MLQIEETTTAEIITVLCGEIVRLRREREDLDRRLGDRIYHAREEWERVQQILLPLFPPGTHHWDVKAPAIAEMVQSILAHVGSPAPESTGHG